MLMRANALRWRSFITLHTIYRVPEVRVHNIILLKIKFWKFCTRYSLHPPTKYTAISCLLEEKKLDENCNNNE